MKIAKIFTKKNPKIDVITAVCCRWTTIDETDKILEVECKKLRLNYFMNKNENWFKSYIMLAEKL